LTFAVIESVLAIQDLSKTAGNNAMMTERRWSPFLQWLSLSPPPAYRRRYGWQDGAPRGLRGSIWHGRETFHLRATSLQIGVNSAPQKRFKAELGKRKLIGGNDVFKPENVVAAIPFSVCHSRIDGLDRSNPNVFGIAIFSRN